MTAVEQFGRFEKGSRVKVRGMPGEYRVVYFRQEGDRMTATVYGGSGGRTAFRTVAIERLVKRRIQEKRES